MNLLPRATNASDCRRAALCVGLTLALAAAAAAGAAAQTVEMTPPANLPTEKIVHELVEHNAERAAQLKFYRSERRYDLEYKGFPHHAEASMSVEVICNGPTNKTFHVLSESGSHFLLDRVLKKLLISEQKAARVQSKNALTPANYRFHLIGSAVQDGRPVYELHVEPRVATKYLYRGEIWVDARDYAVTQIKAEPAKSISFWVRKVDIHHVYRKAGNFWLPYLDQSETKVLLGGTATLTINYGRYNFTSGQIQTSRLSEPSQDRAEMILPESTPVARH